MTEEETTQYVKRVAAYTKKIAASPSKSQKLLEEAGICSPSGKLKAPYKSEKQSTA